MAIPQPTNKEFGPYRRVQGKADADLRRILEATAKAIERRIATLKPGPGGVVRASQLRMTLSAVRAMQRAMWDRAVSPLVQRGWKDAEDAAESAIEAMTRVAYAGLPEQAAELLVASLKASAESGMKSDAARRKRELSQRVYKLRALDEGRVEDMIRQGLIANLSAKELADSVYQYVSPTAPGGASYSAMRLARTEINNAFHERQIQGATRPGVSAVKWNLSGSHKVPDECNIYADHEPYEPDKVPEKPHPQCFCYLTYVTMSSKQFQEELASGDFDDEIERRTRENLARLGQPVGTLTPPKKDQPSLAVVTDDGGRQVPKVDAIRKSVRSGIKNSETLSGGKQAETVKVEFEDGTAGVRKYIDRADAKRQQDAEELVPLIARMMGIRAPEVVRVNEKTTIQQFLPGKLAKGLMFEGLVTKYKARLAERAKTDQGMLIAILDQITFNMDRHAGNWLYDEDNNITIIDHGLAWMNMRGKTDLSQATPFRMADAFSTQLTTGKQGVGGGVAYKPKLDIHPEDLDALVDIMNTLRPEFESRNQLEWWRFTMMQIEAIRPSAKGKKRRIV